MLEQVDILEQSIIYYTQVIFLLPYWDRHSPNIAQNLLTIVQLLLLQAYCTKQLEDVKCAIIYLWYLHETSLEAFNILPDMIKEFIVSALALQIRLELGDVM